MKHIDDIWQRALKTFVQAFCGVLIPELVVFLNNIKIVDFSWSDIWALIIPVICGALAAGISAGWNYIQNIFIEEERDGNK